MSDILATLGLTAARPDPALLLNQQEVEKQIGGIKTNIQDTMNSIDLAVKAAEVLGVSKEYTGKLDGLRAKGTTLLEATNMSPDQLDKKRAEMDAELEKIQKEQEESVDARTIEEARQAMNAVEKRYLEIKEDPTTSKPLLKEYEELNTTAKNVFETIKGTIEKAAAAKKKKEGFQNFGTQTQTVTEKMMTPKDILLKLESLDAKKSREEEKEFNMQRFASRVRQQVREAFIIAGTVIASIIGGILAANLYVGESFWALKLFYFLYGAVFFPFPVLYSLVAPPAWHSTLIPFYERAAPEISGPADYLFSYEPITADALENRLKGTRFWTRLMAAVTVGGMGALIGVYRLDKYFVSGG